MSDQPTPSSPPRSPPMQPAPGIAAPAAELTWNTSVAPLTQKQRLLQLDFLRGISLFGILVVNMGFFFDVLAKEVDLGWLATADTPTRVVWSVVRVFFTFKFISLFSMMFGFGVALQLNRMEKSGASPWYFGFRRFGLLILIGFLHGVFIWYGDILFVYGCMGLALLVLRLLPTKALLVTALVLAGLVALISVTHGAYSTFREPWAAQAAETGEEPPAYVDPQGFQALADDNFQPHKPRYQAAERRAAQQGPWQDAVSIRAIMWSTLAFAAPLTYGWQLLCMMLLGMWAYRANFWSEANRALRRTVALVCLAVGFPIAIGGVVLMWLTDFQGPLAVALQSSTMNLGSLFLPLGYAVVIGGAALWLPRVLANAVACAGRMPLSVYLSESVCATAVSYWWGFGYFGKLSAVQQMGFAVCLWCGLVLLSTLWLRFIPIGPMEYLWRMVSYWRLDPLIPTSRSDQPAA